MILVIPFLLICNDFFLISCMKQKPVDCAKKLKQKLRKNVFIDLIPNQNRILSLF